MGKLVALVLVVTLSSCGYGRASPETCHAKHIRDGKGGPSAYDRCIATYEREELIREERQLGLRPSRAETIIGIVGAAAILSSARRPLICDDGSPSPTCLEGRASNQGCCSWHRGLR